MLVALVAVMLLVPVSIVAVDLVQSSRAAADAADRAQVSAAELDVLLRLAPALRDEHNAVGAAIGDSRLEATVGDRADGSALALQNIRLQVDDLLAEYEDPTLVDDLDAIREFGATILEGGFVPQLIVELLVRYDELFERIESLVEDTMLELRTAVGAAGHDADLTHAATVAELGTQQRVLHASQYTLWSSMSAPGIEPSNDVVLDLASNLALADGARRDLARLLEEDSVLSEAWTELQRSDEKKQFLSVMNQSVDDQLTRGTAKVEAPADDGAVAGPAAGLSPETILAIVARMGEVETLERSASAALSEFVESALVEVQRAAADIGADAARAQRRVGIAVIAFVGLAAAAVWLLVRAVAVPLRRLAQHGRALRDGDMDRRVSISGAAELRLTAQAMNEAAASLKLAERQAVALAEGRMDDDMLHGPVPGTLGTSLQHAVKRLTTTISEREHFQRRLAHEAAHDGLTGLPNRIAVLKNASAAIARADRTSNGMALLFLDLDGFKEVNDTHGHHAGDALLRATADRLCSSIRAGDVAGRLGGDEFVVVAEPVTDLADALAFGHRLRESISQPVEIGDLTLEPSVSIGLALAERAGLSAEELLHDADLAVYRAKGLGGGRVEICDEVLRQQNREHDELEQALVDALHNEEFVLHFQPTVDCRHGRVRSLEALLRWDRPGVGLVLPGDFIPVAERSDLIEQIDRWVLRSVAEQLAEWTDHPHLGSLPVAVNASSRHLSDGQLVDDILSAIDRAHIERSRMQIEITETALLDDLDRAGADLDRLRAEGVTVALDDFGTGYMSLATLRKLPVDIVKIDRSFVAEMSTSDDHSLVDLIINASHLLGIAVIAEGVEREDQARMLSGLGADLLQGWHFARPMEASMIVERFEHEGVDAFVRSLASPGPA